MLTVVLITVVAIAFLMLIMAVGVIFQQKSLRGSCGGPEALDCDGESLSCFACPNRGLKKTEEAEIPASRP